MIGLENRQVLAQDIDVAPGAGARLRLRLRDSWH